MCASQVPPTFKSKVKFVKRYQMIGGDSSRSRTGRRISMDL